MLNSLGKTKVLFRSIIFILVLLSVKVYSVNTSTRKPNAPLKPSVTSPIEVKARLEITNSKSKEIKSYSIKAEMLPQINLGKTSFWEHVTKLGPIVVGLFAVFISYIGIKKSNRQLMKQIALSQTEKKRADILVKLNTFYGPFKELRTQSRTLYDIFLAVMRLEYGDGIPKKGFRTLVWLLEGNRLKRKANTVFQQIIEIEDHLLQLIQNNTGVVDKPDLQDLLGKFATHIRVLRLAYERKIGGDLETAQIFKDLVYPYEIDGAIESATLRLQHDYDTLEATIDPTKEVSESRLNSTIEYYNNNADKYAEKWDSQNVDEFYYTFENELPRGGRILDVGCGTGRDTRHFIKKGYRVLSIDASVQMVRLCNAYPHAFCLKQKMQDINFMEEFDGIWCFASLMHLEEEEAKLAARKLFASLKNKGKIFISVKEGEGEGKDSNGRYFKYYNKTNILELFNMERLAIIKKPWTTINKVAGKDISWLNLMLEKIN